jgi:hypothetical protein
LTSLEIGVQYTHQQQTGESNMAKFCVANRECNLANDSYFYSTFFDSETETFSEVLVGSTAFGGGVYSNKIDAPEEIRAKYGKWLYEEEAKQEATTIRVGKKVSLKNAKKYTGIGIVEWIGKSFHDSRITIAKVVFDDGSYTFSKLNRLVLV